MSAEAAIIVLIKTAKKKFSVTNRIPIYHKITKILINLNKKCITINSLIELMCKVHYNWT